MNNENLDTVLEREVVAAENKNKRKKLIVRIGAGISAFIILITGISHLGKKRSSNDKANTTTTTTITTTPTSSTTGFDLNTMGDELTTQAPIKTTYRVVSGDIDPDKIVEQGGKLYKDATEASEAKNKTTSINLKNDTLKTSVVKGNGTTTVKVYDKTTGYEIKGQGTTTTGNLNESGIPENFEKNEDLNGVFEKEDNTSGLVRSDSNYYNEEGKLVIKKGDVVSKETLEYAKKHLSTTTTKKATTTTTAKPTTTTTTAKPTTTTTTSNQGVVNKDGSYTIYGLVFESKADYQQWVLQGYEGYVELDGVMISEEELNNRMQKTK